MQSARQPEDSHPAAQDLIDFDRRWQLHPRVALRPEPFGALAYHYDNRRLNFLRSPDLVDLVRSLVEHPTPRDAFEAHGLDPARWQSFELALTALAKSDVVGPVSDQLDGANK